mmetsp:Transcript_8061/g.17474  ORF Transcript_8061/g.17474 Transcript_8061/m.17474 type:complete len:113 (-) Transcript_8061:89-427(-)
MAPLFKDETITRGARIEVYDSSYFRQELPQQHQESESCCKMDDPFLYYSNDEVRMKTLKLETISEAEVADSTTTSRRTRISFELHPSVMFGDMMNGLYMDCDDNIDIDSILA